MCAQRRLRSALFYTPDQRLINIVTVTFPQTSLVANRDGGCVTTVFLCLCGMLSRNFVNNSALLGKKGCCEIFKAGVIYIITLCSDISGFPVLDTKTLCAVVILIYFPVAASDTHTSLSC